MAVVGPVRVDQMTDPGRDARTVEQRHPHPGKVGTPVGAALQNLLLGSAKAHLIKRKVAALRDAGSQAQQVVDCFHRAFSHKLPGEGIERVLLHRGIDRRNPTVQQRQGILLQQNHPLHQLVVDGAGRVQVAAQHDLVRLAEYAVALFHRFSSSSQFRLWLVLPGDCPP